MIDKKFLMQRTRGADRQVILCSFNKYMVLLSQNKNQVRKLRKYYHLILVKSIGEFTSIRHALRITIISLDCS